MLNERKEKHNRFSGCLNCPANHINSDKKEEIEKYCTFYGKDKLDIYLSQESLNSPDLGTEYYYRCVKNYFNYELECDYTIEEFDVV